MRSLPPLRIGKIGKAGIACSRFSVLDLAPALWLDAADLSTITESGGAVSQWDDKSGNGHHATQGVGASQPTTGTRTMNGLNVLDFDGSDDAMALSSPSTLGGGDDISIFTVQYLDAVPGAGLFPPVIDLEGDSIWRIRFDQGASNITLVYTQDTTESAHYHFIGGFSNLGVLAISAVRGRRNGLADLKYNTTALSVDNETLSDNPVAFTSGTIGASDSSGAHPFNGVIAEVAVFARALSDTEVDRMGVYLAKKWGLSWTNI